MMMIQSHYLRIWCHLVRNQKEVIYWFAKNLQTVGKLLQLKI